MRSVTDPQGITWQIEKRGAVTYLLTRPGAMRWAAIAEVESWTPPGFEGLVRDPGNPGTWKRAA